MYDRNDLELPDKLELKDVVEIVNRLLRKHPELEGSSEISPRTVHYYVQQQLLPKRRGRGPGTTYPATIVYRLLFIKLLQNRGLSLGDIKGKFLHSAMEQVSDESIKSVLLGKESLDIRYVGEVDSKEISDRFQKGEELIVLQESAPDRADSQVSFHRELPRRHNPSLSVSDIAGLHELALEPAVLEMMDDCQFCDPDTSRIMHEGEWCIAVWDAFPVSQGHVLIVPPRHVRSFFDLSEAEVADVFAMLKIVCADLDALYDPDGYNIGINEGRAAGQTIMHMHLHVIPRYAGDKPDPRGGIRWLFPDKAAYWEK